MFAARASLNGSLPESVLNSCHPTAWHWLAAHVLYSLFFTTTINAFLYIVSLVINVRQLFANPSVHYSRDLEGYALDVAIERGYRRLKLFRLQLIALTFAYVLGAYYYKSIVRNTSIDWLSITRWLIEASCDYVHFSTYFMSWRVIPASMTELNNHFAVLMDMLLIIKTNQFVMMRYAEFYYHSCLNIIRVGFFHVFCPKLDGYSTKRILAICLSPSKYLPDVRR